jgi:hypothetical protein
VLNLPRKQMKACFLDNGIPDIVGEPAAASFSAKPDHYK